MQKLLFFNIFLLVLITFLSDPAPAQLDIFSMLLIGLSCFTGVLCLAGSPSYKMYTDNLILFLAVSFYLFYLILSVLSGLLHDVPVLKILRSAGPYLSFFPLVFIAFLPNHLYKLRNLVFVMVLVGLIQSCYHFYLYYTHPTTSTLGVLQNRMTLIDPRTTLPIFMCVPILLLPYFFNNITTRKVNYLSTLGFGMLILLGLFAGILTLTRSIVLSVLFGWFMFVFLYVIQQYFCNQAKLLLIFSRLLIYLLALFVLIGLISLIPTVQLIESGILARFFNNTQLTGTTDYSNGRLYDEWLPALTAWFQSDFVGKLIGIGAGKSFIVLNGEERTYIHNVCIYHLVYGGIFGLLASLGLYASLIITLMKKAIATNESHYVSFAAFVFTLFFYSQFFAVHKVLAFNLFLFLIIAVALCQPSEQRLTHGQGL